jgi:hypothetical protein
MPPRVPEALDDVLSGALPPVPPLFQGALQPLVLVTVSHRHVPFVGYGAV